ncbi:Microtubule-associated protein futsch [Habropoda laboriosa]|uniref:Microtubule-associated protein futsch n=1 Tax=Habropoda laboriosa TaxID=597456 RepID=A0A0L7RHR1_9HYME|nr:Microtubule-associated protein futsch [Habropoda laboriosa]
MSTTDPTGEGGGGGETTTISPTNIEQNASPVTPVTGSAMPPGSQQQHPPPSPLSGCYLLVVLPEPHTEQHKDLILNRLAKGFLSWDKDSCHVDLEKELLALVAQAPEGEEARNGERLIQYATENLVTEVLIHPQTNTLLQCIRNLLASFTKHRHIIHAGYTFGGNGSWILQDGTFSLADFLDAFSEHEVQRVLRAYENSVTVDIHCAGVGDWTTNRLSKEACTRSCRVRVNPDDVLTAGLAAITSFTNYVGQYLVSQTLDQLMEPSDVVGNIRFSHPTLYVFPGGQGDAALFGINGFNMLVDGGFARKACFWDFTRHLDRLDAVLVTRINNSNVGGMSSVLRKKKEMHVYPQIGHFFCNLVERRQSNSPDGDKDIDPLILNLSDIGQEMVVNLRHINLRAHPCYRDPEPINLYHKVGHGTLDMYALSPNKDNRENLVSICALLVWQPANPEDTITRILFPGSTPQQKIFEGFERLKHLEFLKHPVCSTKSLSTSVSLAGTLRDKPAKQKMSLIEKEPSKKLMTDGKKEKKELAEMRTVKAGGEESPPKTAEKQQGTPIIPTKPSAVSKAETKPSKKVVENKRIEVEGRESKKVPEKESKEARKEAARRGTEKQPPVEKQTEEKLEKREDEEEEEEEEEEKEEEKEDGGVVAQKKPELMKREAPVVKESKPRGGEATRKKEAKAKGGKMTMETKVSSKFVEKKTKQSATEKKDGSAGVTVKSSPTTPKKTVNGVATKTEISKTSSVSKGGKQQQHIGQRMAGAPPAKSTKDANNRKVVEQKKIEKSAIKERSGGAPIGTTTTTAAGMVKVSAKPKPMERKPISRRGKPVSPSKIRVPGSPAKSTRSTPTTSVKSDKDGVVRKVTKSDKGTADSSTVSTPSGIEAETGGVRLVEKSLMEQSEDISLDSIESKVLADLKEEREVVEEIEAVLQKAERIEETRKDDRSEGDDEITAELTDKKEEDITEDDIIEADIEDSSLKLADTYNKKGMQDLIHQYLIFDKEQDYTEDSTQSGEGEQKHVLDEAESEKAKMLKDMELVKEKGAEEEVEEKEKDESLEKRRESEPIDLSPQDRKEQLEEEVERVAKKEAVAAIASKAAPVPEEMVQQRLEEKDDSGKKDSEDIKEPSSFSPDKLDSSEKKTTDTDLKPEADQKEQIPEKLEESQERISTLESGATTTAPTLPEDERIPLDEIKEDIDEKHIVEKVKEKDVRPAKEDAKEEEKVVGAVSPRATIVLPSVAAAAKPEVQVFDVRQAVQCLQRDIVKTPDEVADLPVHEEVDPKLYRMEDFEKDKEEKPSPLPPPPPPPPPTAQQVKEPPTPPVKEQKGVFSFFGKVADKFEKGIDKLTKKSKKDQEKETPDEKSSSKSSSPKEAKVYGEKTVPSEEVDMEKMFPKVSTKQAPSEKAKEEAVVDEVTEKRIEAAMLIESKSPVADATKESKATMLKDDEAVRSMEQIEKQKEVLVEPRKEEDFAEGVEEEAEEIKALLEEASKKFKTVKDSLRDSLESLEEKIGVDETVDLPHDVPSPVKDVVKDTLEGVVEKLEAIKPQIESVVSPDSKEPEKVKFDVRPRDEEEVVQAVEEEKEEPEEAPARDVKEAVRDVGEVLAGTAGIDIEEKPRDVTEIVRKVAQVLKEDDFIPDKAFFDQPTTTTTTTITKEKEEVVSPIVAKSPLLEDVSDEILPDKLTKTDDEKIAVSPIPTAMQAHEEPCVKVVKEAEAITSPSDKAATYEPQDKRDTKEICEEILKKTVEEDSRAVSDIVKPCITPPKMDVMEAGMEDVCVRETVKTEDEQVAEEIEEEKEPVIGFDRKISPAEAEIVTVSPGSTPTSPKFFTDKMPQGKLELSKEVAAAVSDHQLPTEIKAIVNRVDWMLEEIIVELVSAKKRITIEIIEYITMVKRVPRERVIYIIEEIIVKKKLSREDVVDNVDIFKLDDSITPELKTELEEYIIEEYVRKGKCITIQIVEEISMKMVIPRTIVIRIIQEIIAKKLIDVRTDGLFDTAVKDVRTAEKPEEREEEEKLEIEVKEMKEVSPIDDATVSVLVKLEKESGVETKEKETVEVAPSLLSKENQGVEEEEEDVDEDGFVSIGRRISKEVIQVEEGKAMVAEGAVSVKPEHVKEAAIQKRHEKDITDDFEAVEQEYKVRDVILEDVKSRLTSSKSDAAETKEREYEVEEAIEDTTVSDVVEADEKFVHETKDKAEKMKESTIVEKEKGKIEIEQKESKDSDITSETTEASETLDTVEKYLDEAKEKKEEKKVVEEKPAGDVIKPLTEKEKETTKFDKVSFVDKQPDEQQPDDKQKSMEKDRRELKRPEKEEEEDKEKKVEPPTKETIKAIKEPPLTKEAELVEQVERVETTATPLDKQRQEGEKEIVTKEAAPMKPEAAKRSEGVPEKGSSPEEESAKIASLVKEEKRVEEISTSPSIIDAETPKSPQQQEQPQPQPQEPQAQLELKAVEKELQFEGTAPITDKIRSIESPADTAVAVAKILDVGVSGKEEKTEIEVSKSAVESARSEDILPVETIFAKSPIYKSEEESMVKISVDVKDIESIKSTTSPSILKTTMSIAKSEITETPKTFDKKIATESSRIEETTQDVEKVHDESTIGEKEDEKEIDSVPCQEISKEKQIPKATIDVDKEDDGGKSEKKDTDGKLPSLSLIGSDKASDLQQVIEDTKMEEKKLGDSDQSKLPITTPEDNDKVLVTTTTTTTVDGTFEKLDEKKPHESIVASISVDQRKETAVQHLPTEKPKSPLIEERIPEADIIHESSSGVISYVTEKEREVGEQEDVTKQLGEKIKEDKESRTSDESKSRITPRSSISETVTAILEGKKDVEESLVDETSKSRLSISSVQTESEELTKRDFKEDDGKLSEPVEHTKEPSPKSPNDGTVVLGEKKETVDHSKSPSITEEVADMKDVEAKVIEKVESPGAIAIVTDDEMKEAAADRSKSPSVVSELEVPRDSDKTRSASVTSIHAETAKETALTPTSTSVEADEAADLKEVDRTTIIDKFRSSSITGTPAEKSKSPSIAGDVADLTDIDANATDKTRSPSIAAAMPADKSKSPSIAGDIPELTDVEEKPIDTSRSPSVTSVSTEQQPMKETSPSIAGDIVDMKDIDIKEMDKPRSPSSVTSFVAELEEATIDKSKSPSIAGDVIPDLKDAAADTKVTDKSRSPSATDVSTESKEVTDKSKSPSISGDAADFKDVDTKAIEKSRSPSVTAVPSEAKEPQDKSKSPSVAGDIPDLKDVAAETKVSDKSRSPSATDVSTESKEVTDKSKSPSISGDAADFKDVDTKAIEKSRSPSVTAVPSEAEKAQDKSKSPSIAGDAPDFKDVDTEAIEKSRSPSVTAVPSEAEKAQDKSKSPSIAGDAPDFKDVDTEAIEKSRSPSVTAVPSEAEKAQDKSKSPSIAGDAPDFKDVDTEAIEKSRSPSVTAVPSEAEKAQDKSKSPSIAGDAPDFKDVDTKAIEKSRSPSVTAVPSQAKEPQDKPKSPSVAGDIPDLKDVVADTKVIDKSRSPSATDVSTESKEVTDKSKSPSISGDAADFKDVDTKAIEKSRSPSVTAVPSEAEKAQDKSKSPSIAGDIPDLKDVAAETKVTDKSRSPSATDVSTESKEVTEKSKSPSISGDAADFKDVDTKAIEKSRSPSVTAVPSEAEKPQDKSKSPSIAGDIPDLKDVAAETKVTDKSRSPSATDVSTESKEVMDKSKSPSISGDAADFKDVDTKAIEKSRSPSVTAVPSEAEKAQDKSKSPSIAGDIPDLKDVAADTKVTDKSRSPSATDVSTESKEVTDKSKSPSISGDAADFKDVDMKAIEKSRSPSIAAVPTEAKGPQDKSKSPSVAGDIPDLKDVAAETKVTDKSRSPSATDVSTESKDVTDKTKSPSIAGDAPDFKDVDTKAIEKSRSPSVTAVPSEAEKPQDKSKSPSIAGDIPDLKDVVADTKVIDKSRSPSATDVSTESKEVTDKSKSPSISGDAADFKDVDTKAIEKSRSPSVTAVPSEAKEPQDKSKSPSVAGDIPDLKDVDIKVPEESRPSPSVTDASEKATEEAAEKSKTTSIVADVAGDTKDDDEKRMGKSRSASVISVSAELKDTMDKSKSPSIASDIPDMKDAETKADEKSRSHSVTDVPLEPKDVSWDKSKTPSIADDITDLKDIDEKSIEKSRSASTTYVAAEQKTTAMDKSKSPSIAGDVPGLMDVVDGETFDKSRSPSVTSVSTEHQLIQEVTDKSKSPSIVGDEMPTGLKDGDVKVMEKSKLSSVITDTVPSKSKDVTDESKSPSIAGDIADLKDVNAKIIDEPRSPSVISVTTEPKAMTDTSSSPSIASDIPDVKDVDSKVIEKSRSPSIAEVTAADKSKTPSVVSDSPDLRDVDTKTIDKSRSPCVMADVAVEPMLTTDKSKSPSIAGDVVDFTTETDTNVDDKTRSPSLTDVSTKTESDKSKSPSIASDIPNLKDIDIKTVEKSELASTTDKSKSPSIAGDLADVKDVDEKQIDKSHSASVTSMAASERREAELDEPKSLSIAGDMPELRGIDTKTVEKSRSPSVTDKSKSPSIAGDVTDAIDGTVIDGSRSPSVPSDKSKSLSISGDIADLKDVAADTVLTSSVTKAFMEHKEAVDKSKSPSIAGDILEMQDVDAKAVDKSRSTSVTSVSAESEDTVDKSKSPSIAGDMLDKKDAETKAIKIMPKSPSVTDVLLEPTDKSKSPSIASDDVTDLKDIDKKASDKSRSPSVTDVPVGPKDKSKSHSIVAASVTSVAAEPKEAASKKSGSPSISAGDIADMKDVDSKKMDRSNVTGTPESKEASDKSKSPSIAGDLADIRDVDAKAIGVSGLTISVTNIAVESAEAGLDKSKSGSVVSDIPDLKDVDTIEMDKSRSSPSEVTDASVESKRSPRDKSKSPSISDDMLDLKGIDTKAIDEHKPTEIDLTKKTTDITTDRLKSPTVTADTQDAWADSEIDDNKNRSRSHNKEESKPGEYAEPQDGHMEASMSDYPINYESQFHKAFIGGMTEIRTTHITTLSGKSTPDITRDDKSSVVMSKSSDFHDSPDKESISTSTTTGTTTVHVTQSTSIMEATEIKPTKQQTVTMLKESKIGEPGDKTGFTVKVGSDLEEEYDSLPTEVSTDDGKSVIVVKRIVKREVSDQEEPETIRKIIKREIVEVGEEEEEKPLVITKVIKREIIVPEGGEPCEAKDFERVKEMIVREENVPQIIETVTTKTKEIVMTEEDLGGEDKTDVSSVEKVITEDDGSSVTSTTSTSTDVKKVVISKIISKSDEAVKSKKEVKESSSSPPLSSCREQETTIKSSIIKSKDDLTRKQDIEEKREEEMKQAQKDRRPVSPLVRDIVSGRSTPDRKSDGGRSLTGTPEGFRSGEVIRTIITTTKTVSDDGEIITTTREVTETTNEKGETVILAEKVDVKVDEYLPSKDMAETAIGSVISSPSSTARQLKEATLTGFPAAAMSSSFYGELPVVPPEIAATKKLHEDIEIQLEQQQQQQQGDDYSFKRFTVEKEYAGDYKEKPDAKKYIDEADLDFEKALMMERKKTKEPESSGIGDISTKYTNGSVRQKTSEEEKANEPAGEDSRSDSKKDPLTGWGTPLGLPSPVPPQKFNLKHATQPSNSTERSSISMMMMTPSTSNDNDVALKFDAINDWGVPLRLPSPAPVTNEISNKGAPGTPKKEKKQARKVLSENLKNKKRSESPGKNEKKIKDSKNKVQPVYVDLTYVPHHGNSYYTSLDFFKRVRARYYVFSGTEPSREVYDALLEAKRTWEDKDLEVTMIPTYDTDTLGYWVADNEEALAANHIDLSPSASRCTINLQDHETSCSAYRLEF